MLKFEQTEFNCPVYIYKVVDTTRCLFMPQVNVLNDKRLDQSELYRQIEQSDLPIAEKLEQSAALSFAEHRLKNRSEDYVKSVLAKPEEQHAVGITYQTRTISPLEKPMKFFSIFKNTFLDVQHGYMCDRTKGTTYGMSSSGKHEVGYSNKDYGVVIPGSYGREREVVDAVNKELTALEQLNATSFFPVWRPFVFDCHSLVSRSCSSLFFVSNPRLNRFGTQHDLSPEDIKKATTSPALRDAIDSGDLERVKLRSNN